jgi:Ca2+-binding EF-hand superfamily protein
MVPHSAARAIQLFKALDINNDGVVTEDEFIDGEKKY